MLEARFLFHSVISKRDSVSGRMLVTTDVRYSRGTRVSKLQQDIELVETEVCSSSKSAVCVRGNRTDELVLATSCVDYFVLMVSRSVCTEILVSCRKLDSKHVAKFPRRVYHISSTFLSFSFLLWINPSFRRVEKSGHASVERNFNCFFPFFLNYIFRRVRNWSTKFDRLNVALCWKVSKLSRKKFHVTVLIVILQERLVTGFARDF